MLKGEIDRLLVGEHVPDAVAPEDDKQVVLLQRVAGRVRHVGEDRPIVVHLERRVAERARAREVEGGVVVREARLRVERARGALCIGAPPDAAHLEDAAARLLDATLLVPPVRPVVLRQPHRSAAAAQHSAAVADVAQIQRELLDRAARDEQQQRGGAVGEALPPRLLQQLLVRQRERLLHRTEEAARVDAAVALAAASLHVHVRDVLWEMPARVLCGERAAMPVEDTEGRAKGAHPNHLDEAVLIRVLLALPRLSVRPQPRRHAAAAAAAKTSYAPLYTPSDTLLDGLRAFFGLDRSSAESEPPSPAADAAPFPAHRLVARSPTGRSLLLVSDEVLSLLRADTRGALRIVNTGVRLFEAQEAKGTGCAYRVCQDGLPHLLPHIRRQRAPCSVETVALLLSRPPLSALELGETDAALAARLKASCQPGSVVLEATTAQGQQIRIVALYAPSGSLGAMVKGLEKEALTFRLTSEAGT
mmetsp:Transcript_49340/g.160416  ORF Transcript_49340/g.160416 Transcript_49340/m.160416 type:complete len:476 (-) Transcript_49340:148-1575(-)